MTAPTKAIKTKLFIGNLDPITQSSELSELFAPFGNVLEASVIKDYGFVHYGTVEEAEKAVLALNNKEFHGKRLRVEVSTSTVRHRPGQPEPASALRNSRARAAAIGNGNGISRYNPAAPPGGVGPIRHNVSAWIRNDARPYDGILMDPNTMTSSYGRPYDPRADPRAYHDDRRNGGFNSGYDTTRDNYYGAIGYSNPNGEPTGMYPVRDYRELPPPPPPPPAHTRPDPMGYNNNRMYDRNQDASPVDRYYGSGNGGVPQGPPLPADPYPNYDSYQKYYSGQPHDSEYSISTSHNPSSREYDAYSNYRADPYAPPPPPSATYPRHQPVYGNTHGVPPPSTYAPPYPQYYGTQQRA